MFILSGLFMFTSCSKEKEDEIRIKKSLDQEINTRSSTCDLDWGISYNNDDNDGCRDVAIQVNGLIGECENCEILAYALLLNTNDVMQHVDSGTGTFIPLGTIEIGNWENFQGNLRWNNLILQVFPHPNPSIVYTSSTQNQSLLNLGTGEIVDFDYNVGTYTDVELCAEMRINCGNGIETHTFCQLIDLHCE
jgi:hypothetical protein